MKPYTIIQPEVLRTSLMDNQEVIQQMIRLYLSQGLEDFAQLTHAIEQQNREEIHRMAHHIKPTMTYIGALTLTEKLQLLERLAIDESPFADIYQLFEQIKIDFNQAIAELTDYQRTLG